MAIIAGFIVPHPPIIIKEVGRGEEQKIQKTIDAYKKVAQTIASLKPDTILISSPHATAYGDYFHIASDATQTGSFQQFGVPKVSFKVQSDNKLIDAITVHATEKEFPMGNLGNYHADLDHGVMVPLYFINQFYTDYKIVRISPSGLPQSEHYQAGKLINEVISDELKVIWIASGDLSHKLTKDGPYGHAKEGPLFDREITTYLANGDFLRLLEFDPKYCQNAAECGLGSFTMMAGAFDQYDVDSTLLSYEGPFGVGYAVATYIPLKPNPLRNFFEQYQNNIQSRAFNKQKQEDEYVALARQSVEYYILNHQPLPLSRTIGKELLESMAGVFVSIHKEGRLRGCVGTIQPTTASIAEEIIQNAISASTKDYRFQPIKEKELSKLDISVDVLFPAEPITSLKELDVKKYGVIVRYGRKSGLLLPNLDGIDTVEEQVRIALQKAGISERDAYSLERFEVIRHH